MAKSKAARLTELFVQQYKRDAFHGPEKHFPVEIVDFTRPRIQFSLHLVDELELDVPAGFVEEGDEGPAVARGFRAHLDHLLHVGLLERRRRRDR